ncbi:MAG: SDR family NAD(P)-dependent oxidoreductase [Acidimicrobiales bacterium]
MPLSLPVRRFVDDALEATVVGSWSRPGFAARRRLWHWDDGPEPDFAGRTIVVTGGTSGIGRAVATACARAGAGVGIVGRDPGRTERAAEAIAEESGASAAVWAEAADMGSVEAVNALADRVIRRCGRLHGLVHAAGLLSRHLLTSPDGTELTAAVHVVGPHLLTSRLAPLLHAGAPSTVVWVSSGGMYAQALDVEKMGRSDIPYRGAAAYARAKRAQVVLARLWAARFAGSGITSSVMHPGWVDTDALRHGLPTFALVARPVLRRPQEGADTVVWLLGAGGAPGAGVPAGRTPRHGGIWLDRRLRSEHRRPQRRAAVDQDDRLWDWCQSRSGLDQCGRAA